MIPLTQEQKIEFFRRSYTSVDGLWFMKLEEITDFNTALEIDEAVWKIMPKVQARMLKNISGMEQGVEALAECLSAKLSMEGYVFDLEKDKDARGLTISIRECPWYKLMAKSGRQHLAPAIGPRICTAEYSVWAKEFGADIHLNIPDSICSGAGACILRFSVSP